jgi:predicted TIM-barrel fold metal-dependent hydrolase
MTEPTPSNRIISGDSHVMEPLDLWTKTLHARFGEATPRLIPEFRGVPGKFFYIGREVLRLERIDDEAKASGFAAAGFDPAVRVAFQEAAGIAAEVMYPTQGMVLLRSCREDVLKAAARVYNDWLIDFAAHAPARLIAIGLVPMHDVGFAVAELERIAARGVKGVLINMDMPAWYPPYRDRVYDRFWAAAEALAIPVTLHSASGQIFSPFHYHDRKDQESAPKAMLAVFAEAANVVANEFVFGGIFDRFERLQIVLSEFELSWMPPWMWRLDQMQSSFGHRMPIPKLKRRASEYVKDRLWHCMIDDPLAAQALAALRTDRILWGSDFPHVRSIGVDAKSVVGALLQELPPAARGGIVAENTAALYRL